MDYGIILYKEVNVALHPEGVDRNAAERHLGRRLSVALHPEGVDRNADHLKADVLVEGSPSTRRAWIEMRQIMRQRPCAMPSRPPPGGRG